MEINIKKDIDKLELGSLLVTYHSIYMIIISEGLYGAINLENCECEFKKQYSIHDLYELVNSQHDILRIIPENKVRIEEINE